MALGAAPAATGQAEALAAAATRVLGAERRQRRLGRTGRRRLGGRQCGGWRYFQRLGRRPDTLQDTLITGSATAGRGGDGGNGGQGAPGGQGGASGSDQGGGGGKGGSGGASGVSGNGGNAVGAIENNGVIDVIGAAILYNDSATAGTGGVSGQSRGADGGAGGGGAPPGGDGKDGVDGAIGAPGLNGSAHTDSLNNGTIVGALTVDGAYVSIKNAVTGPTVIQDGAGFVSAMVNWTTQFSPAQPSVLDGPSTGTAFWKIVSEPGVGPALSDFTSSVGVGPGAPITSATSGTLNFNTNGDQFENIRLSFTPTSSEPRNETFAIELSPDPSDPTTILGSASTLTINFVNPLGSSGTPPTVTGDIFWQNASTGQGSIWDMDGSALVGGGPLSPNPGPSWTEIGTGDFNHDGHADILWQNASGQASVWDMNGNSLIGGGPVSPNPGPAWKAIGTGDFTDDGFSDDILWQNTSSGQVSIWEMNGNSLAGGGPVSPNPGPAWKAIGTGDFNKDGSSDILFQNTTSGQVSIWEMDGTNLIGGGPVSPNPGPSWHAIGTGDFNHDGFSDILFQNASTGQLSIWEMKGNTLVGGGPVSPNPGPSWRAVGTDGGSDILFQNTSGQASIWDMSGNTLVGGGPVSPNPGPSWHAVALS